MHRVGSNSNEMLLVALRLFASANMIGLQPMWYMQVLGESHVAT